MPALATQRPAQRDREPRSRYHLRVHRALALALFVWSAAASADPCKLATISLRPDRDHMNGSIKGKVSKIDRKEYWTEVHLDDGAAGLDFTMSPPTAQPFAKGDKLALKFACGGGWQIVCNTQLADGQGRVFLISAALGSDELSEGWTSSVDARVKSSPNPNSSQKSVQHTYALVLAKGRTKATVGPDKCTTIDDGSDKWSASGFAIRWEGLRPPEGIDYQQYQLMRQPKK